MGIPPLSSYGRGGEGKEGELCATCALLKSCRVSVAKQVMVVRVVGELSSNSSSEAWHIHSKPLMCPPTPRGTLRLSPDVEGYIGPGAEEATNRSSPPLDEGSHNLSLPVSFPFRLSRHCSNLLLPIYLNITKMGPYEKCL